MEYAALVRELKNGNIRPAYLFHGEEDFQIRQLERLVVETVLSPEERETNLTMLDQQVDPLYLVSLIETAPFFGGRNVLLVRDFGLLKAGRAQEGEETGERADKKDGGVSRLTEILKTMPEYSLVVFSVSGKADKRKKFFKAIEQTGAVVECGAPKIKDARILLQDKLAQLNKRMTPEAQEYYLGVLSMMPKISVAVMESELDKIALYTGNRPVIEYSDIREIMAAAVEINVFEMTEALGRKDIKPALELLHTQLAAGEHPVKILGLLAFHIRRLWQIREISDNGGNAKEVADILKLHPFIAERLFRQTRNFSPERLKQALLQLAAADRALKSGRAGSSSLEQIMIELCMA